MKTIDFKTSPFFSWHVQIAAIGFMVIGVIVFEKSILGGSIIFLACVLIYTTHYRLHIDLDKKVYREYLWIMGLKDGKLRNFHALLYFFIKKNKVSQTMGLKAANTTVVKEVYDTYLKFSDEEKIHILTANQKDKIITKLHPISRALLIDLVDYTDGEAKVVR
jgi:hypothetical protein